LHTIAVSDIDRVQVAEDIHVIGHPHGNLWSYSTGVVSQIRDDYKWSYDDGSKHEAKVLQLQTAISPGNSGGPVVDDAGKILGLVAMSEEGQNIDYAIAADVIKQFLLTGMRMTTRGAPTKHLPVPQAPQQLLVGKLPDSTAVTKAVYSDVVIYRIDGKQSGLVANFSDGTQIRAWDVVPLGDFKSWSAILPSGSALTAVASGGSINHISAKP
jgi:S1-C subfamily serine protease